LIALRRCYPELTDPRLNLVHVDYGEDGRWLVVARGRLRIAANLGPGTAALPLAKPGIEVLASSGPGITIDRGTLTIPGTTFAAIRT
jgi:maltooligosyltrehalose trehalohydrolase